MLVGFGLILIAKYVVMPVEVSTTLIVFGAIQIAAGLFSFFHSLVNNNK